MVLQLLSRLRRISVVFATQSSNISPLLPESPAPAILHFPPHNVPTETNRAANAKKNSPFLNTIYSQSEAVLFFLLSAPLLIPSPVPSSHPPHLVSSFHLWRCCQSASETPGFPFHLEVRDEMRDREGTGGEEARNDPS